MVRSNFKNSKLGCIPEDLLPFVLLNVAQVGTLSRCRQVCNFLNIFIREKKIFERYIATCIPEKEILRYWRQLFRERKPDISHTYLLFYEYILTKDWDLFQAYTVEGFHESLDLLFSILNQKRGTPIFDLTKHIIDLTMNSSDVFIKNEALKCLLNSIYCSQVSVVGPKDIIVKPLSIFNLLTSRKPVLMQILDELPENTLVEAKKHFINELDQKIRSTLFGRDLRNRQLSVFANDRNQEISTQARSLLRSLIDNNFYDYMGSKKFSETIIETNSIRNSFKRAIFAQIGAYCFTMFVLALHLPKPTKSLFVFVECFSAFILNCIGISQILAPIERSLKYGTHWDAWFYQYLLILLVANLTLLATLALT